MARGERAQKSFRPPRLGHRPGFADGSLWASPRALARCRLVRDHQRKLHADRGATALLPRPNRRALPHRHARGLTFGGLDRPDRHGLSRRAERARRANQGALGFGSPLLDGGGGAQHARPLAHALQRRGAATHGGAGAPNSRLLGAPHLAREPVVVCRVRRVDDDRVGLLGATRERGRLRSTVRRQQRLRERPSTTDSIPSPISMRSPSIGSCRCTSRVTPITERTSSIPTSDR